MEHLERGIFSVKERKKGPRCGWTRRKPRWFFLGQIKSEAILEASRCYSVSGWIGVVLGGSGISAAHGSATWRTGWRSKERGDSKNDNNKSVREAGNNNRESASGTRPKGKNIRPFASGEIVFSFWPLLRYTVVLHAGRRSMVSFLFLFLSPRYSSRGARAGEECSEGLKAPDLQVGELGGYRRSRCYPLYLYSLENVRLVLIWFQSLLSYNCILKDKIVVYHDSKYVLMMFIIIFKIISYLHSKD